MLHPCHPLPYTCTPYTATLLTRYRYSAATMHSVQSTGASYTTRTQYNAYIPPKSGGHEKTKSPGRLLSQEKLSLLVRNAPETARHRTQAMPARINPEGPARRDRARDGMTASTARSPRATRREKKNGYGRFCHSLPARPQDAPFPIGCCVPHGMPAGPPYPRPKIIHIVRRKKG